MRITKEVKIWSDNEHNSFTTAIEIDEADLTNPKRLEILRKLLKLSDTVMLADLTAKGYYTVEQSAKLLKEYKIAVDEILGEPTNVRT